MDRHLWYYRFLADDDWLTDFIEDIESTDRSLVLALTGSTGIGSGFTVTQRGAGSNFSVDISAGIGYDPSGRRFYSDSTINVPFVEDELGADIEVVGVGNERIVSIYAEYALVDDPGSSALDGFGDSVFTRQTEEVAYLLYQGAEAGAGLATPAAHPGGNLIRIAEVTIRQGDLTIQNADITQDNAEYLGLSIAPDSVGYTEIDWGLGANQVSAEDIPIRDTAADFTATDVEGALAELQADLESLAAAAVSDHGGLSGLGDDDHTIYALLTGARAFSGTVLSSVASPGVAFDVGSDGARIDLDADNDTSIRCNIDDNIIIELGGIERLQISSAGTIEAIGLAANGVALDLFSNGNRIDLDADNDTSVRCTADDTIVWELGGVDRIVFSSNGGISVPQQDPPTAAYFYRQSLSYGWISHQDGGGIYNSNWNVTSVTDDDGDGVYFVNWDTDTTDDYIIVDGMLDNITGYDTKIAYQPFAASCDIHTWDLSVGALVDRDFTIAMIGGH